MPQKRQALLKIEASWLGHAKYLNFGRCMLRFLKTLLPFSWAPPPPPLISHTETIYKGLNFRLEIISSITEFLLWYHWQRPIHKYIKDRVKTGLVVEGIIMTICTMPLSHHRDTPLGQLGAVVLQNYKPNRGLYARVYLLVHPESNIYWPGQLLLYIQCYQ